MKLAEKGLEPGTVYSVKRLYFFWFGTKPTKFIKTDKPTISYETNEVHKDRQTHN